MNKHCAGCRSDESCVKCRWYWEEMRQLDAESDVQAEFDSARDDEMRSAGFAEEDFDE